MYSLLERDDNGEGGTLLYLPLMQACKVGMLPNQQAADEELSTYYRPGKTSASLFLFSVLFSFICIDYGTAYHLLIHEITSWSSAVLSSISGLQVRTQGLSDAVVVLISCIVLVGLFALQHHGTHRVAFLFAPIVMVWLLCIGIIGLYNTIHWNPRIYQAISPFYMIKFFKKTGKDGWLSLGGILLCITGSEAMFADLGHFTSISIRVGRFASVIYPCMVLQYMGQAAYLTKNVSLIPISFYGSIPKPVFWPVFMVSTLAAIVASQAVISATFSIVKQCLALGCFPRVKVVHTSKVDLWSNIYTRNQLDTHGIACIVVMFVTSCLMALVIIFVWQRNVIFAVLFLVLFGFIEGAYLSSSIVKVPQGGWVPLALAFVFMIIMYVWHYGTRSKYLFDVQNKVSMKWILTLGPSLGIVRVPGIGLIYTELVTGVPSIFSHFVTNLPAFHQVLVFVCVKSVPVPYVPPDERYLIGRIGPRSYRMYRCIIRYGYKDVQKDDYNFEDHLVMSIAEFIHMEAENSKSSSSPDVSVEGKLAVIRTSERHSGLVAREANAEITRASASARSSKSETLQSLQSLYEQESPSLVRRRTVQFELAQSQQMDPQVRGACGSCGGEGGRRCLCFRPFLRKSKEELVLHK
ncbi:hypothetical protein HPP92_002114 [Vanilla planifolia]|uniref:Potassium transporter n=1 Tax=Vanilla planifolia TaxID=51239 RepID=A0A835VHL0_VANPL|nr:hypothetical protein HPP92_002114 [Vanilla planifolia]